jgi:hypothetical protein
MLGRKGMGMQSGRQDASEDGIALVFYAEVSRARSVRRVPLPWRRQAAAELRFDSDQSGF